MRTIRRPRSSLVIAVFMLGTVACAADEPAAVDDGGESVPTTESPDPTGAPTVAPGADTAPTDQPTDDPTDGQPLGSQPPDSTDAPSSTDPTDPTSEGSVPVPGPVPPSSTTPLYQAGDIDQGLQPFFEQAIDDLAARIDVTASEITVHAGVLVVWPDTSLGCPQPGMSYAQVLTDGSVIELEHNGRYYRYHTGGERGPFVCEQLLTKQPPSEQLDAGDGADS